MQFSDVTYSLNLAIAAWLLGLVRNTESSEGFFGCDGYQFSTYKATWETARRTCRDRRFGDLAAFDTDGEYEFVRNIFKALSKSQREPTRYWTSGSNDNDYGIFLWHSSGVLLQNTPSVIKHIIDIPTFILTYTRCAVPGLCRTPLFLYATMGNFAPLISHATGTSEHYFVCEVQTHECRVNRTLNVDTQIDLPLTTSSGSTDVSTNSKTPHKSKADCYVVSRCKTSFWYGGGSCRRRGYGDLLSIDSQEEADLALQLLQKSKSREQFWTTGRRISNIEWENSNTILSRKDMPAAFDWYFETKYKELILAVSVSSTAPGGLEWEFLDSKMSLRFMCELETPECKQRPSRMGSHMNVDGEVSKKPGTSLKQSDNKQNLQGARKLRQAPNVFHLSKFGNRCYIFYNGTIHPEELQGFCRSYGWEGFEMDQPEERQRNGTWKRMLDLAERIFYPDADTYESIPVCTSGVAKTEYVWMPHDGNRSDPIDSILSIKLQSLPKRHLYLYQRYSNNTYEHHGWKINSADEPEIQRCHPVCEKDC